MLHFVPHRKNQAIQGSALSALHSKKQRAKAPCFFERLRRPYYPLPQVQLKVIQASGTYRLVFYTKRKIFEIYGKIHFYFLFRN